MSRTAVSPPRRRSTPAASGGVRPEIQALRALAVMGVVLYHLWPTRLSGGYVGVDVFFVVSGYLITDHLLREVERSGPPRLVRFWSRRARRLLPASFLTIACTAVAVWAWVPETRWPQFGRELWTSTFYVQNWELARQSIDYMALSNVKSPTQHFWSLGVEEQFYLVWPVLIAVMVIVARRLRRDPVSAVAVALALVLVVSLAHSIDLTGSDPGRAYFVTTTRVWEFAAGGLLAWAVRRRVLGTPSGAWAVAMTWAGSFLIILAMVTFDDATAFPGVAAALPVLGTITVIAAGAPAGRLSLTPLMRRRPVQFTGDVSYGVYLWHWPLIILLPYALGHDLTRTEKVLVLAASLTLGWLSKRLVEDPLRRPGTRRWQRPAATFAGVAVASAAITIASLPLAQWSPPQPPSVQEVLPPCFGATAQVDPACGDPEQIRLEADVTAFSADLPPAEVLACETYNSGSTHQRCDWGVDRAKASRGIVLVGDSHATRWVEPFAQSAEDRRWHLSTITVTGCSMATTDPIGSIQGLNATTDGNCASVTRDVFAEISADPTIDTVVLTNRTRLYAGDDLLTPARVEASIIALQNAGKQVVVLVDPPEMSAVPSVGSVSAADCLAAADQPAECSLPVADATFFDPMRAGAEAAEAPVVDLTDLFCGTDRCYSRIGGLVVYSDDNHLTRSFAASTREVLAERIDSAVRSAG